MWRMNADFLVAKSGRKGRVCTAHHLFLGVSVPLREKNRREIYDWIT